MKQIRIATRQSPLALWQAEEVTRRLKGVHAGLDVQLVKMTTRGDKILDTPLNLMGGKGLFVKELELGLIEERADIAVHSMKDVPMLLPPELHLPVIMQREDPRDAFVSLHYDSPEALPAGAKVGTSSLRRRAQFKARFPELEMLDLRGNVGTRLDKLDKGEYEAIILAAAGLIRLGLKNRITQLMDPQYSLPAVGQAAIGIECRRQDPNIEAIIAPLNHENTAICVRAERAFNQRMNGGCHMPIAAFAELDASGQIHMRGLLGHPNGSKIIEASISGKAATADALGIQLAEIILQQGGLKILQNLGMNPRSTPI